MKLDNEKEFFLRGDNGHVHLKILEVFGFPMKTSHSGGYDTLSSIEIISKGYKANGELYISTGEIYEFGQQLEENNRTLNGVAKLYSTESNLKIEAEFDGIGHVFIKGSYREDYSYDNELGFELVSDQTFMTQAINGIKQIALIYGTKEGLK